MISDLLAGRLDRPRPIALVGGHADACARDRRTESGRIGAFRHFVGRDRPGQAIIELALFLGFFLMLSLGVYEFGRAFQAQIVVIQAAREGARLGSDPTTTVTAIQAAATAAARPYTLSGVNVTFPTGQVRVTATYRFTSTLSPLWFIDDFDINSTMIGRRV
jgi:Flp pilus assembly protein TadG